mmetsp:Transcript_81402/g.170199  ORF Transcript_81402/g.170199 Transcript_81402/m.170199 type:complete len:87 (-) Transcript_81402:451-711(-)
MGLRRSGTGDDQHSACCHCRHETKPSLHRSQSAIVFHKNSSSQRFGFCAGSWFLWAKRQSEPCPTDGGRGPTQSTDALMNDHFFLL